MSEADKAHRLGRWVGWPLVFFICAALVVGVVMIVGLVVAIFSIEMHY